LPPYLASLGLGYYLKYLAFDPTLSPPHYYEVLAMQEPFRFMDKLLSEGSEWPPSIYMMGMYSSSMTKWKERSFAHDEGSATTIAHFGSGHWHVAYLNRARQNTKYASCLDMFLLWLHLLHHSHVSSVTPPLLEDQLIPQARADGNHCQRTL
jgi:hypothetical protein